MLEAIERAALDRRILLLAGGLEPRAARRTWPTPSTASSSSTADIIKTPAVPIVPRSVFVSSGPTNVPTVPPAAIGP